MHVSQEVESIVDYALKGVRPGREELLALCGLDPFSLEAAYVTWGAQQAVRTASEGVAEVHAQIGIDANPCSKNCLFCSFASCNTARSGKMEMPLERIIEHARSYVDEGANCLTIMITADYDFGQYVEYLAQVREAIGPAMPLCANMGDFDEPMAQRLKAAGVGSVYHAVRMGEGQVNEIPLEQRFATIDAAHAAGLKVMTCLEMIRPAFSNEEVVDNMLQVLEHRTEYASAGGMIRVPGTQLENCELYIRPKQRLYSAVMRLAAGPSVRFGGGNLNWAEVGTNPRDASNATEEDGLGWSVEDVREDFEQDGWKTYRGPSPWW